MPIYEYKCNDCANDFEKLVSGSNPDVSCPDCNSKNISKKFSLFGMSGVENSGSGCSSCTASTCKSCKD